MIETFFDFLDGPIKVEDLIPFVLGYIVLMWVMFSLWVLIDAKKRYENWYIAIAFFLLVLPVNFPALIFYLIIRPEGEEEIYNHLVHGEQVVPGGVNVPIANFIGKEGVDMSINLQIFNPEIVKQKETFPNNLDVQLKWDYNENQIKIKEEEKAETKDKPNESDTIISAVTAPFRNAFSKIYNIIAIKEEDILKEADTDSETSETKPESSSDDNVNTSSDNKKKKKKKKRR